MKNPPGSLKLKLERLTLLFVFCAGISPAAFADAPPGAYLDSTNKTQKASTKSSKKGSSASASASAANANSDWTSAAVTNTAGDTGPKYGRPLGESLPDSSSQQSLTQPPAGQNWAGGQGVAGWPNQQPNQQVNSQPYSGYAQQSSFAQQSNYPPPAPEAPVNNMSSGAGGDWQADYPSLNELNGGAQQSAAAPLNQSAQLGQPAAPSTGNPFSSLFPQSPLSSAPKPSGAQATITKSATNDNPDDATNKTLNAIANTVLPIAATMVQNAIMNKMMYGTMTPGYGAYPPGYGGYPPGYGGYPPGYGNNPYGAMRNPMGGYGYNKPNILNGILGGNGNSGGILNPNMH